MSDPIDPPMSFAAFYEAAREIIGDNRSFDAQVTAKRIVPRRRDIEYARRFDRPEPQRRTELEWSIYVHGDDGPMTDDWATPQEALAELRALLAAQAPRQAPSDDVGSVGAPRVEDGAVRS